MIIAKVFRSHSDPNDWNLLYCSISHVSDVISDLEKSNDLSGVTVSYIDVIE